MINFGTINKKYLLLVGFFVLMLIIFLLLIVWPQSENTEPIRSTPQPRVSALPSVLPGSSADPRSTPLPINPQSNEIYSPEYIREQEEINRQQTAQLEQDQAVSRFIDSLPYNGQFLSVTYTLRTNQVTVIKNAENVTAADNELSQLLLQHNIENISWIKNIVIQSR